MIAGLSAPARGHLAMLCFSALIAGSFALGSMAANHIAPLALMAARFGLAIAIIAVLAGLTTGIPARAFAAPWRYLLLGSCFAIYFVLMFEGLKTAPPVSTAAVFTLTPAMAAGFGWLILRQFPTARIVTALLVGAAGALWVIFRGDPVALMQFAVGRGEAIFFVGCAAHALYIPLVRRLNRGENALVTTLGVLLAGSLVLVLAGWGEIAATDWWALPARVWVALAYLVVIATAVTFVLIQFASMRLPSSKVMAYSYLTPTWVIGWELALGHGVPPALVLGGIGLTLAALALLLKDEV